MINKLQLDDFELSYTCEGEGRDVLFLHGFPSNMFFWDDIKNDLKDKLRVTVVSPPTTVKHLSFWAFFINHFASIIPILEASPSSFNEEELIKFTFFSSVFFACLTQVSLLAAM